MLYYVEVYTDLIPGVPLTRYLAFESYTSAANCIMTLKGKEPGVFVPEDFFEAATIYKYPPIGEQVGEPEYTDWVTTYLEKVINNG